MTQLYLAAIDPVLPPNWQAILNAEEQQLAKNMSAVRALEYIQTRYWLRQHLAVALGCAAATFRFRVTAEGKPYVIDHPYYFNLSHSAGHWALALSSSDPVGVDLELGHLRGSHLKIARRFFTPAEVAWLNSERDSSSQRQLFYRIWTGKEAIVKALGLTLMPQLQHISISAEGSIPPQPLRSWPYLQGYLSVVSPEPITVYRWDAATARWQSFDFI